MSEVVLQTIVEKLVAIEIALLKDPTPVKEETIQALLKEIKLFKSEMIKLPLEFEKSTELLKSITALKFKLDSPKRESINHTHHLQKGIWITVGLFIFFCLFLYGWICCSYAKKSFEANDLKYRFLKVNNNPPVLKIIFQADSLYNANKDSFAKLDVAKEQILEQQAEQIRLAGEKKKAVLLLLGFISLIMFFIILQY